MKYFKKTMCMLLASATLLTGCSIGGKEIVLDINTTNSHTVFSVDNMKCGRGWQGDPDRASGSADGDGGNGTGTGV